MKEFWNSRYENSEFAYGTEPNEFFRQVLTDLDLKGRILLPAEGEGRNAVFAAKAGLEVTAYDWSQQGKEKASQLAKLENQEITYLVGELSDLEFKGNSFDIIALIYAHFSSNLRSHYHRELSGYLKTGGILIFEAFSKKHLDMSRENPEAGGPKNRDMLFSLDEVRSDFPDFEIIQLEEVEIALSEGLYHQGKASVIRFVGRKY